MKIYKAPRILPEISRPRMCWCSPEWYEQSVRIRIYIFVLNKDALVLLKWC